MAISKEQLIIELKTKGVSLTKNQLKKLDKATGGATKSFGLMAAGVAGATVALYAMGKSFAAITKTGKAFEQGMANVKAVSGATASEFRELEASAKKLGASTKFTATEISGLQTSFAKLGFTATEINKVTKGTLALASAVGADLAESAAIAGSTLRGFGLDTKETGRVTDVMAKSFSSSALDMQKFSDAMTYVAPVAKLAGFSIEGTTAIMGQLANAGIDGSMAGTALRKIFLELSNESSKLSQRLGGSVSSVEELIPALQKLNKEGVSTAEMKDLVGQRAISAFSIMLSGSKDVKTLAASLKNAGGSAQKMADIQLDTLEGKMTIMKSATEGLQISLFDTFSEELKFIVEDITTSIQKLTTDLELQKIRALQNSDAWGEMTNDMKRAIKEQEIALAELALKLEEEPGLLYSVGVAFKDAAIRALDMTFHVKGMSDSLADHGQVLAKHLKMSARDAEAIELRKEELVKLRKELEDINQVMKNVDLEIGEEGWSEVFSEEDMSSYKARLADIALLTGESVETLAALRDETWGDADETDPSILAKRFKIQSDNALDTLIEYGIEKRNIGRDSRLVELEEEEADILMALEALGRSEASKNEIIKEFGEKRKKIEKDIDKARIKQQRDAEMQMLSGAVSALNQFKGTQKAAARIQQIAATIDAYRTINKAMAELPFPTNIMTSIAVGASAFANVMQISKSIGEFKTAATGLDEIVTKPTMILAGESGAEHIGITPLDGINENGPQQGSSITLNISAPLVDETVVESIIPAMREALRRGETLDFN